jgi:hypothetical protein
MGVFNTHIWGKSTAVGRTTLREDQDGESTTLRKHVRGVPEYSTVHR